MSAQTTYNQATPRGVAGGLVDLSAHAVNTRINGQADATLKFGMGVVQGSAPGSDIKIPATGATADKFEGITVNGYTNEMDMDGAVSISPGAAIGVLQYGKIWARIKSGDAPAYLQLPEGPGWRLCRAGRRRQRHGLPAACLHDQPLLPDG